VRKPDTIVESLAIGDPGSGFEAIRSMRATQGFADDPTDAEILEGVRLLARTEGVFSEPAGGTVVATLKRAREDGRIDRDERVILLITGNGLKTPAVWQDAAPPPAPIPSTLAAVDAYLAGRAHG